MKKWLNYILLSGLILSFFITIVALEHAIDTEIKKSASQLDTVLSSLLELAAKENGNIKTKNIPISGYFNNNPKMFGTYETRTFRSADTTFTYQHKIVDIETRIATDNQYFLLLTNSLRSKDVQTRLDSLLIDRKLHVRTAIGIRSSGYPVKNLPWSSDTLAIHRNGCAQYTMIADFSQIHYTAYLEYAPATIWAQINKRPIALWGITILVISSLLGYQIINERKRRKVITEKEKGLSIEDNYIRLGKNRVKATPQSITILQMFLNAEQHKVDKETLKELWVAKGDRTNSMYSAVTRINKLLNEIECDLKIATDSKDINFYLLG